MNIFNISRLFLVVSLATFLLPTQTFAYFTSSSTLSHLSIGFGDWTPPTTTIVVLHEDQPITPRELVTNGSFDDELNGWSTTGAVLATPRGAKLGNNQSFGTHTLQQTLQGKGFLHISYTIFGADQPLLPIFIISINDEPIIQSTQTNNEERTVVIPLTHESNTLTITLHSDPLLTSSPIWAEVSHITTSFLAVGAKDTVQLTSTEPNTTHWFAMQNSEAHQYAQPFTLTSALQGVLHYWGTDDVDNKENPQDIEYVREDNFPKEPFVEKESWSLNINSITLPQSSTTCPTSYIIQPSGTPLPLSPFPFIDGKKRAFFSNNTPFTLTSLSCFLTVSPSKEISFP